MSTCSKMEIVRENRTVQIVRGISEDDMITAIIVIILLGILDAFLIAACVILEKEEKGEHQDDERHLHNTRRADTSSGGRISDHASGSRSDKQEDVDGSPEE